MFKSIWKVVESMKSDLRYIIKRIIVGVSIALILMLIKGNVFAASIRPTLTNCTLFYGSNSSDSGTMSTASYNSLAYRNCTSSTSRLWTAVKYNYQSTGISNGNYIFQFLIRNYSNRVSVPSVMILSGTQSGSYSTNSCYVSSSEGLYIDQPLTTSSSYSANSSILYYSVYCPNVEIRSGWFQVAIQGGSNNTASDSTGVYSISQDFNYSEIVSSSDINSSIVNSSSQAHSDSQNTQNAINSVNESITSDSVPDIDTSDLPGSDMESIEQNVLGDFLFIPINFLRNIVNGLSYQCSELDMGSILGVNIKFPCIQPQSFLGVALWGIIDIILTGTAMIAFASRLKEIVGDFLSLGVNKFNLNFKLFGG